MLLAQAPPVPVKHLTPAFYRQSYDESVRILTKSNWYENCNSFIHSKNLSTKTSKLRQICQPSEIVTETTKTGAFRPTELSNSWEG